MEKLTFGYETPPINSIYINGIGKEQAYYDRINERVDEYNKEECHLPFKHILKNTNVPFEDLLVSDCIKQKKKFIYLIEILYSNPAWINERLYQSFSPWPNISEQTKNALCGTGKNQGRGVILLTQLKKQTDSIKNDFIRYEVFKKLHIALDNFGISPKGVVYVGASPELPVLYKKFCKKYKIKKTLKAVYYINYFEKGWSLYFEKYSALGEIFNFQSSKESYGRIRPYKFLCFNREPRAHRKLNLLWMIKKHLLKQGLVSFSIQPDLLRFDKENPLPEDEEFKELMKNQNFIKDLVIDIPGDQLSVSFHKKKPFADTYFSFLIERVFDLKRDKTFLLFPFENFFNINNNWTLLTPKVFKAITNMHPFIILGQKGYLKALRGLGYKSFHPFINESYDVISNPIARTKAVWDEMEKLCSLSLSELHEWYYSLMPVLEHNWGVFLKRMKHSEYDCFIKEMQEW